jgi:ABC-type branched-subunit amino acid transport system ATPase component/ABC-type branched-subunit amino acid transport system permease subunit
MTARAFIFAALLALVLLAAAVRGWLPGVSPGLICTSALHALALIGLNLIFGVVGMLAFGQAAFMALPAYFVGILLKLTVPFALAVVVALVGVALLARLVAEVFVRLPGAYLAVGTLGFGMVVEGLGRAFPTWTGGASGLVFEEGRRLGTGAWLCLSIAALVVGLAFYAWYVRGPVWRCLLAIRQDELAAAVLGINVHRAKATVFTIGCIYSAVAGLLLFQYVGVVIPEDAGVVRSLEQIGTLLLGGAGFVAGPVIGSFLVDWFFVLSGYAARFEQLAYGSAFLLTVMFAPRGVCGLLVVPWRHLVGQRAATLPSGSSKDWFAGTGQRSFAGDDVCLSIENVSQAFGGVQALRDVSFAVRRGEIFTLVGPNGAGKTTLFNIVSGVLQPAAGRIVLAGIDITGTAIHRRAALIGRSFQTPRLVPELSVLANVMLRVDQIAPRLTEREREAVAQAQLEIFDLGALARRAVADISLGQRKLIDIARAAAGSPPLVLLDEPAVGLTAGELVHLSKTIRRLRNAGGAVVVVEHNIAFISDIAERGIVLDIGRQIAAGTVREIMAEERVKAAYFGALS